MLKFELSKEDFLRLEKYIVVKGESDGDRCISINIKDLKIIDIIIEFDEMTNEAIVWDTQDASFEVVKQCVDKLLIEAKKATYTKKDEEKYEFYEDEIKLVTDSYSLAQYKEICNF